MIFSPKPTEACPCQSGQPFDSCCGPLLRGDRQADSALALMRSRYTAYVLGANEYLLTSWHAPTRPPSLALSVNENGWNGLEVLECRAGEAGDAQGWVHFRAHSHNGVLEENSHFVCVDGRWFYADGDVRTSSRTHKVGRNEPCPCGSGKKFKKCCG